MSDERPTVRKTATVTPGGPVDGTVRRRGRGKDQRPRTARVEVSRVHPLVWQQAVKLRSQRPGTTIVVVDEGTVVVR